LWFAEYSVSDNEDYGGFDDFLRPCAVPMTSICVANLESIQGCAAVGKSYNLRHILGIEKEGEKTNCLSSFKFQINKIVRNK